MADGVIDSLSIEIGASSKTAEQQIMKLTDSLKKLKAVSNTKFSFKNLSESISTLSGALKAVNSESVSKLRQLSNAVKTFEGVKDIKISKTLPTNLADLVAAVDLIKKEHSEKLANFGNAMQSLAGKKVSIGDKLPTQIQNLAAAADGISDSAITKLFRMGLALKNMQGVNLSGLGRAVRSLNSTGGAGSGTAGPKNSRKSKADGKSDPASADDPSSDLLTKLKKIRSELAGKINPAAEKFGNALKKAASFAKNIAKSILGLGKKILGGVANLGKNLLKFGANSLLKLLGIDKITRAFSRLNKLIGSFGRIALYRAFRSAIKYVTDALKEGTENAYWFSKEFGNVTKYISEAYDEMESKNFKMSNQLGAAWSTLIATIQPIILQVIDLVTRAANAVTQFFAVLGGKSTYMQAIDYTKDWADATDDGSKAAKEWKNQLMGFDEINRLEEPSDSNRSNGKNNYDDYENMFVESPVGDLVKEIKDLWESGEFAKLGQILGNKLNEMIDSVKWGDLGQKIGQNLNGVIETAYSFLKSDVFSNLGKRIAEFLNNASDMINFNTLGRLQTRIKTALLDVLYNATVNLDWKNVAINLSNYIIGALDELADWIESLDPAKIGQAIRDFFGNIKSGEIGTSMLRVLKSAWDFVIELRNEIWNEETKGKVQTAINNFFGGMSWEEIRTTIQTKLSAAWNWVTDRFDEIWPPENRETFMANLKEKLSTILKNAIGGIDGAAIHNIFSYKLDEAIFGAEHANRVWENKGDYAGRDFISGISGGIVSNSEDFRKSLDWHVNTPVDEALQQMVESGEISEYELSQILKSVGTDTSGAIDDLKQTADGMTTGIQTDTESAGTAFGQLASDVKAATGDTSSDISDLKNTVSTETSSIKTSLDGVSSASFSMSRDGSSAMSSLSSSVASQSSGIIGHLQNIISWAQNAWNWITNIANANAQSIGADGSIYLQGFATGGFPEDGLFMANHGELIGQFANGRTAVANNEQITDGIADAVYSAFMSAFSQTGGNGNDDKPVNIYLDGRLIAKSTTRYQQQFARANG